MELLIICLLILISFLICHESKKITESFQPDERQFTYCLNYDNTNQVSHPYYGIVANSIKQPPDRTGLFTSLVNKPLNFTSLKSIPHCENPTNTTINTPDYFPDLKIIDYKQNTYKPQVDPHDTYSKPDDNYSILYNDKIQSEFLKHNQEVRAKDILSRKNEFIKMNQPKILSTSR